MKAMAVNPRRSPLRTNRVHFVRSDTKQAFCALRPRNGWREMVNRAVDCPKCLEKMARELDKLPTTPNWQADLIGAILSEGVLNTLAGIVGEKVR